MNDKIIDLDAINLGLRFIDHRRAQLTRMNDLLCIDRHRLTSHGRLHLNNRRSFKAFQIDPKRVRRVGQG